MHDHAPAAGGIRSAGHRRLLTISLCLTATIMVVQVVGALLTGSLALLADAAHMFTDASALVIALIAAAVAARLYRTGPHPETPLPRARHRRTLAPWTSH